MIDPNALATYFGGDTALLRKFAGVFAREAPGVVSLLDEAMASGDLPAVALHAHTLKSQIRYFGYADLADRLQEIEQLAEGRTVPEPLAALVAAFNRDFHAVYREVAAVGGTGE